MFVYRDCRFIDTMNKHSNNDCSQFNTFWVYITPFVGGIIADTLWGRYKTILVFSLVCLLVILFFEISLPDVES